MTKRNVSSLPFAEGPETFLSLSYGVPTQVGRIIRLHSTNGRAWALTSSGVLFLFPPGGFDFGAFLDHSGL